MIQFIKTTKGLKDKHQEEFPLFEKTYIPPGYGNRHVSRLYADGSLYYLISSGRDENGHESEKWNYISAVTEKGLSGIKELLSVLCKIKVSRSFAANNQGTIIWKLICDNQIKEYITAVLPEEENKIFGEIDSLINFNMRVIPPGE